MNIYLHLYICVCAGAFHARVYVGMLVYSFPSQLEINASFKQTICVILQNFASLMRTQYGIIASLMRNPTRRK